VPPADDGKARFDWHPEPLIVAHTDPGGDEALAELGRRSWAVALDTLFGVAVRRPTTPLTYGELRRAFFGSSGRPAPPPEEATPTHALLEDYRIRVAPHHYNPHFPRSFGYLTPPPLPMSVVGELLAQ